MKGETQVLVWHDEVREGGLRLPELLLDNASRFRKEEQPLLRALSMLGSQDSSCVYKGFVDDARNTDHAWIETIVVLHKPSSSAEHESLAGMWVPIAEEHRLRKCQRLWLSTALTQEGDGEHARKGREKRTRTD